MKESQKKEKRLTFDSIFGGFFIVLALGIGCLVIIGGTRDLFMTKISKNWPGAEGKISSTTIEEHVSWTGTNRKTRSVTYGAIVNYTYTVNGQVLTSHRINYGGVDGGPKIDAQKIVARYPVGKKVTVYYNPKDPQKSVLESGGSVTGIIICFIVGAVFLLIGGLLLLLAIPFISRKRRAKQPIEPHRPPE